MDPQESRDTLLDLRAVVTVSCAAIIHLTVSIPAQKREKTTLTNGCCVKVVNGVRKGKGYRQFQMGREGDRFCSAFPKFTMFDMNTLYCIVPVCVSVNVRPTFSEI